MREDVLYTLYQSALSSLERAYAPFSNFRVGAAVLMEDGNGRRRVFTGVNVENSSYGLTVCAERVAVFKGVSEGFRRVLALSIAAVEGGEVRFPTPCGACRQVLAEFSDGEMPIYNGDRVVKLADLLPSAFRLR